jgi:adenosylcobyric acid synthase
VVVPGSKATVADLTWLRQRGIDAAIRAHAAAGRAVLGICGGFQMLCRRIADTVESGLGTVDGLGLLDATIVFAPDKTLRHHHTPLRGYEIHHGQLVDTAEDDWLGVGIRRGAVFGTHWHGLLDNNAMRRDWLAFAAVAAGREGFIVADDVDVPGRRDAQLDLMADLLTVHLDTDAVLGLLDSGPPARQIVTTGLRG